jgi:hypothetical protein
MEALDLGKNIKLSSGGEGLDERVGGTIQGVFHVYGAVL